MRSSPVSRRRIVAMATDVPSVSVPVSALNAAISSGGPLMASMSDCATDPRPSTWSMASASDEGAMTGLSGASSPPTSGVADDLIDQGVHL